MVLYKYMCLVMPYLPTPGIELQIEAKDQNVLLCNSEVVEDHLSLEV